MKQLLYRYNPWWDSGWKLTNVFSRAAMLEKLETNLENKSIIFISGIRRAGKSTLMKLLIDDMIYKKGIDPARIFYVSVDDYTLINKSISEITDEFRKIHGISFSEKIWLFFDEITYVPDYEIQLKNLTDKENVKIFVSASSASLLRSGKPYLTGRNKLIEVQPLNFEEYLIFRGLSDLPVSDSHLYEKYFENYMLTGGIPEFVISGDHDYLKELVDDIIMKDIAAQHNVRTVPVLKECFLLFMERAGKAVSLNKIANILKISPDTARRYLDYFENSYLLSTLSKSGKTNEVILSQKKIYSSDLGIRNHFTGFRDKGSLFENYIYNRIKYLNPGYISEGDYEIDFMTENGILIECKYKSELKGKQQELFNRIPAAAKFLLSDHNDLERMLRELGTDHK